ncbi:hypothetical protein PVAG01_07148 [Phlyctema vagabunda]|uniref:VPS37 C-terminal domain-containing protein n=1 Tax=Phlyctema vagabunda TaxID=108571 RepID=A0ABR4PBK9_9HELO
MASPPAYPAYNRLSQQPFNPNTPPAPPPKPVSRRGTPAATQGLPPPPPDHPGHQPTNEVTNRPLPPSRLQETSTPRGLADPGEQWLPSTLEEKSKQDLAEVLSRPELLLALTHAKSTAHPSVTSAQAPLQAALSENLSLAAHLNDLEARLNHLRDTTQAQLMSTHALERQWRSKQSEMDRALAPFSPSSLYQKLGQGVQEQEMVCRAMEESFLEGDGATATEREASDWVRKYREAKKVYYSRQERKERWDEGRVGGWR